MVTSQTWEPKLHLLPCVAWGGADIIVFSEGGLGIANYHNDGGGVPCRAACAFPHLPPPYCSQVASGGLAEPLPTQPGLVPCTDPELQRTAPALAALSCAARRHAITVPLGSSLPPHDFLPASGRGCQVVYDTGDLVPCRPVNPFNTSLQCSQCPPEGIPIPIAL